MLLLAVNRYNPKAYAIRPRAQSPEDLNLELALFFVLFFMS